MDQEKQGSKWGLDDTILFERASTNVGKIKAYTKGRVTGFIALCYTNEQDGHDERDKKLDHHSCAKERWFHLTGTILSQTVPHFRDAASIDPRDLVELAMAQRAAQRLCFKICKTLLRITE